MVIPQCKVEKNIEEDAESTPPMMQRVQKGRKAIW
jgi:hypothetical protein